MSKSALSEFRVEFDLAWGDLVARVQGATDEFADDAEALRYDLKSAAADFIWRMDRAARLLTTAIGDER
jgi:hypothetical protein